MPLNSADADRVRVLHMIDAGQHALEFTKGRERADFDSDAMLQRAVVNCLQEIGEAAIQVSENTRLRLKGVPWIQIARMRNRLVHAYFAINLDLVWDVVINDLRPLIDQLETFVKENP
jgi:uncharacterized protein with HEPN domain